LRFPVFRRAFGRGRGRGRGRGARFRALGRAAGFAGFLFAFAGFLFGFASARPFAGFFAAAAGFGRGAGNGLGAGAGAGGALPTIRSGRTHWSNWSGVRSFSSTAAALSVIPFLCACFAILAALS
jgi:hypothetical protein